MVVCPPTLPRPKGNKTKRIVLSEAERAYMQQEYETSKSLDRVALKMGISANTVKKELKKEGVQCRTGREYLSRIDELEHDYVYSDLDIKEMAIKYGVGKNSLFKLFAQKGWTRLVWKRRYFREVWQRKMSPQEAEQKMKGVIANFSERSSGSGNPMYGKPTPQGSGNGWKGWYKGHYFRSLREATFMIRMDREGKEWKTAERKEYTIPYMLDGRERTYRPDFVVNNQLIELKPTKLHASPLIVAKKEAAEVFCATKGLRYILVDEPIRSSFIARAYIDGLLKFAQNYQDKFVAYLLEDQPNVSKRVMKEDSL
jgi:hypothetical protein